MHTPLQLAQYAATLASKGDKYKPQMASAIIGQNGKETKKFKPLPEELLECRARWNESKYRGD